VPVNDADLRAQLSLKESVVEAARRVRASRSGTRTDQQRAAKNLDAALDAYDHARGTGAAKAAE